MSNIPKFRRAFKIDEGTDLGHASVAIDAVYESNQIAFSFLGEIQPRTDAEGFRIHSLINLLGRVYEHAQAMLVAISTGSPTSAEALARIVVEGSINVMYLATLGNCSTLTMFYRGWLTEHDRKLSEWKAEVKACENAHVLSEMIEARRGVVTGMSQFLEAVETQCSIPKPEKNYEWPKSIFKRFESLGRATDYYESYHRLSGSSHLTGEDTLIWLASLQMPGERQQRMAEEAWAYSIMMTRMASIFFIDAAAACVISYHRENNRDLQDCRLSLQKAVHEIAKDAGAPVKYEANA